MTSPLFITTSPSDFHILKPLVIEQAKLQKIDFLVLFKLQEGYLRELKKLNINLILKDLKLKNKESDPASIEKDLNKVNKFITSFIPKNKSNIAIVLGDRYELLPIVQVLYLFKKRVIHIHGGEITEGSWDDAIRHSISKLSHIHFVSSNSAKEVLLKMGESRNSIYNYGSLGAETVNKLNIKDKRELYSSLNIDYDLKSCLLVFLPITNKEFKYKQSLNTIVEFLLKNKFDQLLVSKTNSDPGSLELKAFFNNIKLDQLKVTLLSNLGMEGYISLAKHADLVIGNSSSFIFELPIKNIKSIMVTDRQKGRIFSEHIFNSQINMRDLVSTYNKLLSKKTKPSKIYLKNDTSLNMAKMIFQYTKEPPSYRKVFNDS